MAIADHPDVLGAAAPDAEQAEAAALPRDELPGAAGQLGDLAGVAAGPAFARRAEPDGAERFLIGRDRGLADPALAVGVGEHIVDGPHVGGAAAGDAEQRAAAAGGGGHVAVPAVAVIAQDQA